jgi:hypothetical protein
MLNSPRPEDKDSIMVPIQVVDGVEAHFMDPRFNQGGSAMLTPSVAVNDIYPPGMDI